MHTVPHAFTTDAHFTAVTCTKVHRAGQLLYKKEKEEVIFSDLIFFETHFCFMVSKHTVQQSIPVLSCLCCL